MPKQGVLSFTVATASPRHNKTKKNTKMGGRDANMMNGREALFGAGDETLGGKRNFERERDAVVCSFA
jgi:hypothetical protein